MERSSSAVERAPTWVRPARPGHNPAQTDRMRQVLPYDATSHDPFLMLNEDWFSRTGFDWHPHRGFETVTVVLDGVLEHMDNAGGHGILRAGDVQWTTTGSGVLHTEVAHEKRAAHTLQLWLNLPARLKMSKPRYQDLRGAEAPVAQADKALVRVFSGDVLGVKGKAENLWPATVARIEVQAGGSVVVDVPAGWASFLYVTGGALQIGGQEAGEADVAWFEPAGQGVQAAGGNDVGKIRVSSSGGGQAVFFASKPIREPVAAYGPFVMNTHDEIIQTVRDYQSGKFGDIPAR